MKQISRNTYLQKLIDGKGDGFIKIVTGIRRAGKSYLLDPIFKGHLLDSGVPEDHIIIAKLDADEFSELLEPHRLTEFVKSRITDSDQYYALLDEVQLAPDFVSALNGFLHIPNLDVYVTGSNSKFLSSDIVTEFRGRGNEIHMYPLSFTEFMSVYEGSREQGWIEYYRFGGLPQTLVRKDEQSKMAFLDYVCKTIYINDVVERNNIKNQAELDTLVQVVSSSTGSLTNPYKLENTFKSELKIDLNHNTINDYLNKLEDAFIIEKVKRFDVKGKKYINTPVKYYFSDPGVRNAFVEFRQVEENHLMENIIYTELCRRGYRVDIGVVEIRDENRNRKQTEVDFVANLGDRTYYIQSALTIADIEKRTQEAKSLENIDDHFTKIIIAKDAGFAGHEKSGIVTLNLLDFLLDESILDKYQ